MKKRREAVALIVCGVLMFVWIAVVVVLTGGREMNEFTSMDKAVFAAFIVVEVLTCVVMFILALRVGKLNTAQNPQPQVKQNTPKRGGLLLVVAYVLSLLTLCIGITTRNVLPKAVLEVVPWVFAVCALLPPVLLGISLLANALYTRRMKHMDVRRLLQYFYSHRDNAQQTADEKQRFLSRWGVLTDIYAGMLALLGLMVAFFGPLTAIQDMHVPISFYGTFLLMCGLCRLRIPNRCAAKEEEPGEIKEKDFPEIYRLAKKAADAVGCRCRIRIFFNGEFSAGLANDKRECRVYLGLSIVNILTEQELYAVFLHEFAHAVLEQGSLMKLRQRNEWIGGDRNPHFLSGLTDLMYGFADSIFLFHYSLYRYAASLSVEAEADRAMVEHGDASAAGAMLIKLKYQELYRWEDSVMDYPCLVEPEEPDPQFVVRYMECFARTVEERKEDWRKLVDKEILARNASHPTVGMRLDALGVADCEVTLPDHSDPFGMEFLRITDYIQRLMFEDWKEGYEEEREDRYLNPLEEVEQWEQAGRPVTAETYGDILEALRSLGRNSEMDALCCRVLDELNGSACDHAAYMHGCYLLHRYDPTGMEYIYRAMESNSNYIEEGLSVIGEYCCMVGDQEGLDTYRERAVELVQKDRDVYSQLNVLDKKDNLSPEQLPPELMEQLVACLSAVDDNLFDRVYLVRKTITADFFTSAVVLRFRLDADDEKCQEAAHRVFRFLDSCDWQFSLFYYENVTGVGVEQVENSCIYTREK